MRVIKFRLYNKLEKEMMDWEKLKEHFDLSTLDDNEEDKIFSSFMQHTGLRDIVGRDIYEGDILLVEGYKHMQVKWNKELALFGLAFKKGATSSIPANIEIVGNIYENPELLD